VWNRAAADVGDFTDDSLTCSITKRDAGSNLIPTAGITTRQSDEKMVGVNYPYDLIYDPPDQNQEKVLKCVNPMKSAIYTLTESVVTPICMVQHMILNRLPCTGFAKT